MDKRIIIGCALSLLHLGFLQAQMKYFNRIIDFPRKDTDTTAWTFDYAAARYGDHVDSTIFLCGQYRGLTTNDFWLLEVDESGHFVDYQTFQDTTLPQMTSFNPELGFRVRSDSTVFISGWNLNESLTTQEAYLYEINVYTGKILYRVLNPNPVSDTLQHVDWQMNYNSRKKRLMVSGNSYYSEPGNTSQFENVVTLFDENLQILSNFSLDPVPTIDTYIFPVNLHAEYLDSGKIINISVLRHSRSPGSSVIKNELRFLLMEPNGEVIKEEIYVDLPQVSRNFNQFEASRLRNGDWILYLMHYDPGPSSNLFYPIVIRMNANFTDTLWTKTLEKGFPLEQGNRRYAWDYALNQDSTALLCISDQDAPSIATGTTAWLHKVDLETGNEIFTKQIEPLVSDQDSIGFARFSTVKPSPYGGFLITGSVGLRKYFPEDDRTRNIEEVWLLHIDENGCFLPDCDSTVMNVEEFVEEELSFLLYPNPSSDMMVLQLPKDAQQYAQKGQLIIYDRQGRAVMHKEIDLSGRTSYMLPVHTLAKGHYFVSLQIGEHLMSQQLVVGR